MLVLGDSVLWGEGLKTEHKSWYHVKLWIERTTGRSVIEKIEAHSGAVVEDESADKGLTTTDGEVNIAQPTIWNEIDRALQHYGDGSKVDLVLVTGCVNDIGLPNLLNASGDAEITQLTEAKCGAPMQRLLQKIMISFPNADVIVTGYYLSFSEKTRNDFVLRALARRFLKTDPAAAKLTRKESFDKLIANSKAWHQASNKTLGAAVDWANAELKSQGSHKQVMFTDVQFAPEHAFGTHETRLWGFDRSPLRMMLVLLSFGKILLPSNDEVRGQRSASCKEVFKRQPNESAEAKKERKNRLLLCRYAALGHPNRQGALLYSAAITNLLKTMASGLASSH
ncbi:MAG TPA: SGNH/GDSL hydrolase family protein [Pyrinomonadaceae bacterium]|nr:SGNH/GDSL hydrolase family protein [Pyrinomonadaceae bacterium]